jgi:Tfp pilus assembly protein PilO
MFKKNKVIIGIVLLVGIFVEIFAVYGMQMTHLRKQDKKVRELRQQIEAYDRDAVRIPEMTKTKDRLQGESLALESIYLGEDALPTILSALGEPAKKVGVKIESSRLVQTEDAGTSFGFKFYYLPVSLSIQATYHQLGRFLNMLENADIPLRVKSLKVLGDGKDLQIDAVIMGAAKEETGK